MFLAAMIDVGVPSKVIRRSVARLGNNLDLSVSKIVRGGLASTNVHITSGGIKVDEPYGDVRDAGGDDQHGHRHYKDIRAQVAAAGLDSAVAARALDIFDRLARAEASLHGTSVDEVAFHELGALDALADVVGAAAACEWLAPRSVSAAPVSMGAGRVRAAHGFLPVPSPAALAVLVEAEAAIDSSAGRHELCTPTGAAILASIVTTWGSSPPMRPMAVGYGAGDLELDDRPNVLRVTVGESLAVAGAGAIDDTRDRVIEIECNLDDISGEICAYAAEQLLAAGALDVWWTPVQMKKGRPAQVLSILCPPARRAAVLDVAFAQTSTIGVRIRNVDRIVLIREQHKVATEFGDVEVKVARRGGAVANVAPEFESCAAVARRAGVGLKVVYAAALAAFSRR